MQILRQGAAAQQAAHVADNANNLIKDVNLLVGKAGGGAWNGRLGEVEGGVKGCMSEGASGATRGGPTPLGVNSTATLKRAAAAVESPSAITPAARPVAQPRSLRYASTEPLPSCPSRWPTKSVGTERK